MYKDFDQLVKIIEDCNVQLPVRKAATGFDNLAEIKKLRKNIDTVTCNDGFDFIKSIMNNVPSTKSAAKNLLSLMESKKLLHKRKTRGGEHYITNYPDIIKQLLANKKSTII